MPRSRTLSRAFAITSSSRSRPIAAKTGLAWWELTTGLALCATTQIEQEADSVLFGWLWVDSATAVHNIKDRQSHVNHRKVNRIRSCIGLDSFYRITVALRKVLPDKLLWGGLLCLSLHVPNIPKL